MKDQPAAPLEYRLPPPPGSGPAYLVSRLITSYIGYAIVMIVLALIVPRFAGVFGDFRPHLPKITLKLLGLSWFCRRYYLWAVCFPLPALWAYANYNIKNQRLRRGSRVAAIMLVLAFLVVAIVALLFPTLEIIDNVSSSATKP